jgi:hypothetical protein
MLLLFLVATLCSLVQFPSPAPIYFCYCAALPVLAAAAGLSLPGRPFDRYCIAALLVFYLLFAALRVGPCAIYQLRGFVHAPPMRRLQSPRAGGLQVENAAVYNDLIPFVQLHAENGYVIAGPECADVYALSGLQNPGQDDSPFALEDMFRSPRTGEVKVVVLNEGSFFGWPLPPRFRQEIYARWTQSRWFGHYQVRWR